MQQCSSVITHCGRKSCVSLSFSLIQTHTHTHTHTHTQWLICTRLQLTTNTISSKRSDAGAPAGEAHLQLYSRCDDLDCRMYFICRSHRLTWMVINSYTRCGYKIGPEEKQSVTICGSGSKSVSPQRNSVVSQPLLSQEMFPESRDVLGMLDNDSQLIKSRRRCCATLVCLSEVTNTKVKSEALIASQHLIVMSTATAASEIFLLNLLFFSVFIAETRTLPVTETH